MKHQEVGGSATRSRPDRHGHMPRCYEQMLQTASSRPTAAHPLRAIGVAVKGGDCWLVWPRLLRRQHKLVDGVVGRALHRPEPHLLELLGQVEGVVLPVLAPGLSHLEGPATEGRQVEEAAWIHVQDGDHTAWAQHAVGLPNHLLAGFQGQLVHQVVERHNIEGLIREAGVLGASVDEVELGVGVLGNGEVVWAEVQPRGGHPGESVDHLICGEATTAADVEQRAGLLHP
mmetsp:Transcript_95389/g.246543  ORF Transcript_95389/g.246543 Transcript_95389/m.246543 type:complete len:230 (+) Transcript_95389:140-829(+)